MDRVSSLISSNQSRKKSPARQVRSRVPRLNRVLPLNRLRRRRPLPPHRDLPPEEERRRNTEPSSSYETLPPALNKNSATFSTSLSAETQKHSSLPLHHARRRRMEFTQSQRAPMVHPLS